MKSSTSQIATLAGQSVLFVMAAEAEYGPHLRRLFTPFLTGVGPVEAGVRLGAELAGLRANAAAVSHSRHQGGDAVDRRRHHLRRSL